MLLLSLVISNYFSHSSELYNRNTFCTSFSVQGGWGGGGGGRGGAHIYHIALLLAMIDALKDPNIANYTYSIGK